MSQSPFGSQEANPYESPKQAGSSPGYMGAPPGTEPVLPGSSSHLHGLAYWEAIEYQFRSPNWMMNLFWGFLAVLSQMVIPVAGPVLFLGYQFRVTDALIRSNGQSFPDFNWDDVEDYFMRGLWAILAAILVTIVTVPFILGGFYCGMFGILALLTSGGNNKPEDGPIVLSAIIGVAVFLLFFAAIMVVNLVSSPLMLRAGLGKDFSRAFDFRWVFDFAGRMWGKMVLSTLFLTMMSLVLMPLGLVVCFVGIYASAVILQMAGTHFWYQWYVLYLQAGGEPIYLTLTKPRPMQAEVYQGEPMDPPQRMN